MNSKFETVFRTYSYRLYPTKMQQLELKALFDLQDHAFNDWADLANRGVAQGKSYETIQKDIESHEILTERPGGSLCAQRYSQPCADTGTPSLRPPD